MSKNGQKKAFLSCFDHVFDPKGLFFTLKNDYQGILSIYSSTERQN